ncbi:hypothetical protein GCM10018790_21570 [Kitasatospora xanthocidica]|uniref:hypothetical protein n=1 Tax=Kitasatospora xanthocidica TaxID=83382 RepID=UPI00167A2733|nr:hypothetical protein [Kitasatospora xanthocidica]GHF43625.1 hypothetical protein GCM10018790_21570 [Kitasatospora xanthocidica]
MANDQSETPVASAPEHEAKTEAPAAAVEAGKAVEGAVAASSNPAEYTAPTDEQKSDIENDLFGDEAEHVVEPTTPATGQPGKKYVPENVVGGHP